MPNSKKLTTLELSHLAPKYHVQANAFLNVSELKLKRGMDCLTTQVSHQYKSQHKYLINK